jgi:hypothetical protein
MPSRLSSLLLSTSEDPRFDRFACRLDDGHALQHQLEHLNALPLRGGLFCLSSTLSRRSFTYAIESLPLGNPGDSKRFHSGRGGMSCLVDIWTRVISIVKQQWVQRQKKKADGSPAPAASGEPRSHLHYAILTRPCPAFPSPVRGVARTVGARRVVASGW